jgi:predicted dehydrogenase
MEIDRREFISKGTKLPIGIPALTLVSNGSLAAEKPTGKLKVALVGTGIRGTTTWGKKLLQYHKDYLEMVALCDINPKRVAFAKRYIGTGAPVYLAKNFDQMIEQTKPDIDHGASYFRRWHGKAGFSGTLLCHKASHHFDQMNWYLDAEPVEVNAFGNVAFYGKNNAFRSKNCRQCAFTDKCEFYWDINKDQMAKDLYVACEEEDGYFRDGCVWDPGHSSDFRLTHSFKETKTWHIEPDEGTHGGSDVAMKDQLFIPGKGDPLGKMADSRAGVMASLIGIAARESIKTGKTIRTADLIQFPQLWGSGS